MPSILIIDDDPVIQLVLKRTLQEQGYEAIVARSGDEGLMQALEHCPALIICDWLMAGMDGTEVCRQIRANPALSSTFFILLTARTNAADRHAGLDAGADEVLYKPLDINALKAAVLAGLQFHSSAPFTVQRRPQQP